MAEWGVLHSRVFQNFSFFGAGSLLGFLVGWVFSKPWDAATLTIVAIVVGPISAVLITLWRDNRRAKLQRQWDIFRNLMRHRKTPLHVEFVGSLNLIEVEFADDEQVIENWKKLLVLFEKLATIPEEQFAEVSQEIFEAQTRLLDAIAKNLGLQIEQLDIQSGGYSPKGWFDLENEQTYIRQLVREIALGKRKLNVTVWDPPRSAETTPPNPFKKTDPPV